LAAAAGKLGDTYEARDALLSGLQENAGLQKLLHGAGQVRTLAFSFDGTYLASGGSKGVIHVWDAKAGKRIATLNTPNEKSARSLAFRGGNETLTAYDEEGVLAAWRLSPDGPHAISNMVDHEYQADTESVAASALLKKIEERDGKEVRTFTVSSKQDILATSDGEAVRVWNVNSSEQMGTALAAQQPYIRALAFSPSGVLVSGSSAGTIAFWDVGKPIGIGRPLKGLKISSNSFAFSPDGQQLAGGDYDGDIALWQLDEPSVKRGNIRHGSNVYGLKFGPNNQLAAFGGDELKVWDLGTGELVRSFSMTMKLMSARVIGPNFRTVALGGNSGELSLWDMETGELLLEIPNERRSRLTTLAFHPNGEILAAAGNGRYIHLFDVKTGHVVAELDGHKRPISDIDFSADGRRLASYDSDGTLMVWDVMTHELQGRPLQRTSSYSGSSAMALSPDGQIAVTSNKTGGLNIWHVDTWRSLGGPVVAHSDYVGNLKFSPDGNWLLSGGLGGEVFLWDLRLETWMEQACAIANRDLTDWERTLYLSRSSDMGAVCALDR
jgi:WD40 repeat protein